VLSWTDSSIGQCSLTCCARFSRAPIRSDCAGYLGDGSCSVPSLGCDWLVFIVYIMQVGYCIASCVRQWILLECCCYGRSVETDLDVVVKNGCGTCDFSPITATPACQFGHHSSYTDTQLLRSGLPFTLTGQERVCRGGRGRTVHSAPMPLTQIHNCSGLHGDGCTLSRLLHFLYFHVRPRVHIQS
jgi:hypothetical protein